MPSSLSSYQKYLRDNLPEYALAGTTIPAPPAGIVLTLNPSTPIKHEKGAAPFPTTQPARLEFTGEKRLGQLKHFKGKRDKIITYLRSNCPRKDLVLKQYRRWDDFTVGLADSTDEDVIYRHLAVLNSDTAIANSGFAFYARSLFGKTTMAQKEACIKKYMAAHCLLHVLVHFEHNNLFFIASTQTATGLGSGGNAIEGIFHFFSKRQNEWIDVQGTMLTSMSQLTNYCTDISGPLSNLWNEHKIAAEVKRYTEIMEAAGFAGRDPFQQVVAEVEVDLRGGAIHDAVKGVKEAVFGKHCRTHPLRATRMALSKLFSVLPGIVRQAGTALASSAVTAALDHSASAAHAASSASSAAVGERVVPRWVQDVGLSPSEDELNQQHWHEIQEHIHSLEKWESRFGDLEARVQTERRTVVTCADMNELLRCYAKIQFHLDKLVACYEQEVGALAKIGGMVADTKLALAGFETAFKTKAVEYLNQERAKVKKRSGGTSVFQTGGGAYQRYTLKNLSTSDATMDDFLAHNAELRSTATDPAEIPAED